MFPKESDPQEIGRMADKLFQISIPDNWLEIALGGDRDYGLDYLVQLKDENKVIKYNFFVQLKGTKDISRVSDDAIKVKLSSKTLNYYANQGLVLLVACDLNKRELYYEFMHNILINLVGNKRYITDTTREYTISIDKRNLLNKETDINEILESYAHGVYKFHRKRAIEEEFNIEELFDDTDHDYEIYRRVEENHYVYRRGKVSIESFIPHDYDFDISCLITFKLRDTKNSLITPDHKTILKTLFSGYKSSPYSSRRKWLVAIYNKKIYIQLGHVRLEITPSVLVDLSIILDDLFEVYSSRVRHFEDKIKSNRFSISRIYSSGFKLIKIKRGLWYHIHQFARRNESHLSNGEWNIFGCDNYFLRVHMKEKGSLWSGNIVIGPEPDSCYTNYMNLEDEVILSWNSLSDEKHEREESLNKIQNIEEVYLWLTTKLIPKVVFEIEENNKEKNTEKLLSRSKSISFNDFLLKFNLDRYICWDYRKELPTDVRDNPQAYLYEVACDLQTFFHQHDDIFIEAGILVNLYEGILTLVEGYREADLSYIYGNLSDLEIDGKLSKQKLVQAISDKIHSIENSTENHFRIDLILRSYISIARDGIGDLNNDIIEKAIDKLQDIINYKHTLQPKYRRLESFG